MKTADRLSAVIILGICVYFWIEARRFSPLSGLFPQAIIVILGTLALVLLVASFIKPAPGKVFGGATGAYLPVLLSAVLIVAWTVFITVLGFLTSSLLFFSLMTVLLDRGRLGWPGLLKRLGLVWALVAAFYLFFDRVLWVSFPRGVLL